jgi:hypothetical protein
VGVVGPSTPESVNLMRLMLLSMTAMESLSLVKNACPENNLLEVVEIPEIAFVLAGLQEDVEGGVCL